MNRPLAVVLLAVLSVSLLSAQQTKVLAPHTTPPPKLAHPVKWHDPAVLRSVVGGLWTVDPSYKSTIFMKNAVETDAITVTPILYLSNGRRYSLKDVKLEPAGVVTLSINQALADQGIASYATLTGYVEIDYTWPWNALCASVENVDLAHSLIFSSGFSAAVGVPDGKHPGPPETQVLDGMWWKQEQGVAGFVALSNTSAEPTKVSLQVTDSENNGITEQAVTVSPHGTKTVLLNELLQPSASSGGIRVSYEGTAASLIVNGVLEDPGVGYSAAIPFAPEISPPELTPQKLDFVELGLMAGAADPMMSFPAGTTFTPYSVLRNISSTPTTVTPTLRWMERGEAHSKQLAPVQISPGKTKVLNVPSLISLAGLRNFNGNVSLEFDGQGPAGGLLMAAGSVDQKNTYVFEVRPSRVEESQGRSLSYWDTANGDDTMVTVWNPADETQELIFRLSFTGGQYKFPIHLAPRALQTFNISEIINNQIPDADGNTIPATIHAGSADLEGTEGENQDILVAMEAGTYNVVKATCVMRCTTCHGATQFWTQVVPFSVAVSGQTQLNAMLQYDSGAQSNITSTSAWSSDTTSVATVSSGLVHGVSSGSVNISATSPIQTLAGTDCQPYTPPPCPRLPMQSTGPGNVVVVAISIKSSGSASSDDSARDAYNSAVGRYNLGAFVDSGGFCTIGYEASGNVTPTNYTGTIILVRTKGGVDYKGSSGQTVDQVIATGTDDTSSATLEDQIPNSGGSSGVVYDLDAPGRKPATGEIWRKRINFFENAQLPDGTYVANEVGFYVRLSCKWGSTSNTFATDVSGDNVLNLGSTTTTWNLQ